MAKVIPAKETAKVVLGEITFTYLVRINYL